tara:strand:- start:793 stop:1227 length:435 start_codon:yes stop_codon:yes gene_type:complete
MLRGFAPSKHLSLTFRENRFKASALSRCEKAQCEPAWQRAGGAALGCMRFTRAFGKSKPLLTCLSSSPAHFSVELMQYMGSTSVFLRSYDNLSNSHVCEAEIKSIVDESRPNAKKPLTPKLKKLIPISQTKKSQAMMPLPGVKS